jgi:hypothetical protein
MLGSGVPPAVCEKGWQDSAVDVFVVAGPTVEMLASSPDGYHHERISPPLGVFRTAEAARAANVRRCEDVRLGGRFESEWDVDPDMYQVRTHSVVGDLAARCDVVWVIAQGLDLTFTPGEFCVSGVVGVYADEQTARSEIWDHEMPFGRCTGDFGRRTLFPEVQRPKCPWGHRAVVQTRIDEPLDPIARRNVIRLEGARAIDKRRFPRV